MAKTLTSGYTDIADRARLLSANRSILTAPHRVALVGHLIRAIDGSNQVAVAEGLRGASTLEAAAVRSAIRTAEATGWRAPSTVAHVLDESLPDLSPGRALTDL